MNAFRPTMRLAASVSAAALKTPVARYAWLALHESRTNFKADRDVRSAPNMIIPGLVVVGTGEHLLFPSLSPG